MVPPRLDLGRIACVKTSEQLLPPRGRGRPELASQPLGVPSLHRFNEGASTDWLDRLFERAPVPAWCLGVAFAAVVLGVVALASALIEDPWPLPRGESLLANRDLRLGLTITALAAYTPAARHYLLRAAGRNLAALRRLLGPRAEKALATRTAWLPGWVAWLFLLVTPAVAFAVDRDPGLYFREGYWHVGNAWTWGLGVFTTWCLGRIVIATLGVSRDFSAIAAALPEVDPLDRAWLAPFTSQALFSALLWLLVPVVWAVNLVDAPFLLVVPAISLVCVAVGTTALVLPTRGVRRRLEEARERELAAVHGSLRGDAAALDASLLAGRLEDPGVADLVAWARYVADLSTSPFTQATRLRFLLYLALPLGSWLGGALVDWLLERVLA